jgi:hypothetical protein
VWVEDRGLRPSGQEIIEKPRAGGLTVFLKKLEKDALVIQEPVINCLTNGAQKGIK